MVDLPQLTSDATEIGQSDLSNDNLYRLAPRTSKEIPCFAKRNQRISDEFWWDEGETRTQMGIPRFRSTPSEGKESTGAETENELPNVVPRIEEEDNEEIMIGKTLNYFTLTPTSKFKIKFSNESISKKHGSILHFTSADGEFTSTIDKLLIDLNYIDLKEFKRVKISSGKVTVTPKGNSKIITEAVTRSYLDEPTDQNIKDCLNAVASCIKKYKIDTLRI